MFPQPGLADVWSELPLKHFSVKSCPVIDINVLKPIVMWYLLSTLSWSLLQALVQWQAKKELLSYQKKFLKIINVFLAVIMN